MTPLQSQAADHLLDLVLKCDLHQVTNINSLVDSYRALKYVTDVPLQSCCELCVAEPENTTQAEELVRLLDSNVAASVPTEDGVALTQEAAAPAKRTRRSKEQIAADEAAKVTPELEPPAETPETPETPEPATDPEPTLPEGEVPADPEAVKQQIREVFGKVKNKEGAKDAFAVILKEHKAANVTLLKPEQVSAVLKAVLAL